MMGKNAARWSLLLATVLATAPTDGAEKGEKARKLWSMNAVRRPELSRDVDEPWIRNPIDGFVLKKLREQGLDPAPEADRRTLIRRLTFDLTGLPPRPEEVDAFLSDERTDAYNCLVDRLLASPHYGERWGRHWLDLVRFAETHGYERDDPKPHAWRYRDWVIAALNQDVPYDRFLTEQLAGDELPGSSPGSKTATGMYRVGLIDDEPPDPLMDRFDQLDDVIKTVGTTMLGLTIHCARCHDHKFDPITQADYYRLLAFFSPSQKYIRDNNSSIELEIATAEERTQFDAKTAVIEKERAVVNEKLEGLYRPIRETILAERRAKFSAEVLSALNLPAEKRDAAQKKLADEVSQALNLKAEDVFARLSEEAKKQKAAFDKELASIESRRPPALTKTLGLTDTGPTADPTMMLVRGDAHRPGAVIQPAFLSSLTTTEPEIVPPPQGKTTGRRLTLARWIASAENPLTARVMVNRLWQHHFGQGIVATPSDFGTMGEEPSHPELLDWLASEFVAQGWSLKAMHRLMVTSSTYRQSGTWNDQATDGDPSNTWLWRMSPMRLEAEPIRDAILFVSGAINLELGGPSVMPPIDQVVLAGQSRPGSGWERSDERSASRRSVYVKVKRSLPLSEIEVLDAADNSEPCPRRSVTTTAPQALAMLNGTFLHEQAAKFARRLEKECGDSAEARVARAFRLAFGRRPTPDESRDAQDFLKDMTHRVSQRHEAKDRAEPGHEALRAFCLVLLNSNEFLNID
ncbi:DUF1549 and DUF1553 domain-containing protein [Singulisphaera sp. PoT]|uniref:DUF1549 and DUF1553 domain-containing protein n=1 Tax=Singulisphaera sp. PoT TaxID=3411797 RepID=UPI003BF4F990